jgi:sirohydrochlorin ferrochelatase
MTHRFSIAPAWLIALAMLLGIAGAHAQGAGSTEPAFLAVAADRGFQGNEEIRDAFDAFAAGRNAELAFVTDARTGDTLARALARLAERGATRVFMLPLFLSAADPKWALAQSALAASPSAAQLSYVRPFGESYFAVEALAERLRAVPQPQRAQVIVAGYGADSAASQRALEADLQRIVQRAAAGFGFKRISSLVWYDSRAPEREARREQSRRALADAARGGAIVVPFHLGRRLDGMMSYDAELQSAVPAGAELLTAAPPPEPWLGTWMAREANRAVKPDKRATGVIVLAHGSDYHWNETMRETVRPLEAQHPVEYVFSMADQPLIERAVRRLEARGARAAVIVRVFGLQSSFRDDVERMIGADIEGGADASANAHVGHHAGHGGHGGHGGASAQVPPARIRTPLALATAGGVEAHPLFARALLERAKALSREPQKETVILVAHGTGDDRRNQQWLEILGSIAAQIKADGTPFRSVRFATWREDWPDKRGPWIQSVRQMVDEAQRDGGRAIVIPARTNGTGPERTFLEGKQFELGQGFAPHPLFMRWVDEQVGAGIATLAARTAP